MSEQALAAAPDARTIVAATGTEPTPNRILARLLHNKLAMAGAIYLVLIVLVAGFAPLLAPHDEVLASRFQDILLKPSRQYWLGTDRVGRDIASRLMFGARYALFAAGEAVAVALIVGVPLGLVMGFFRGWTDRIVMRAVEAVVAVPAIVMAMAIIAGLGTGLGKAMLAVGLVFSMVIARLVRAEVFAAREELYVDSAITSGASSLRVMFRHVLPNVAPTLIVQATLLFAQAVLAEAGLSFLGIGASHDQASWGVMLREAQGSIDRTIWPAIPPGVMVFLTVVAFSVFGDGFRDAFARQARSGRLGVGGVMAVEFSAAIPPDPSMLVSIRDLSVVFPRAETVEDIAVVSHVELDIERGAVTALVGESGSGKSITALALMGLVPEPGLASASSIVLDGKELVGLPFDDLRKIRGTEIGIVFQEPFAALNPSQTIGYQVAEPLRYHRHLSKSQARSRVIELLAEVGIPDPQQRIDAYPHQFSGGMAQRVMIAMALACEPKLLIADEPTTALDVTVQGQILDLIKDLAGSRDMAVLLITHDLGVVADLADQIAVMYAGEIVESGRLVDVFVEPQHPYTEGLIRAIPRNGRRTGSLPTIPGVVPSPWDWPESCHFADRCSYVEAACRASRIELRRTSSGTSRCRRVDELALDGVRAPARTVS